MSRIEEAEKLLANMTHGEKARLLQRVVCDLGDAFPGIDSISGVCGDEPCIVRTRIPVWVLVQARRLGTSEADLLRSYPTLRAEDLANAWAYYRSHRDEIEQQISENETAWDMARLYADENFPLPAVEELRTLGHDVLTIQETGKAGQTAPDEAVLGFACAENRILLTLNRQHFIRLHNRRSLHEGIVVCTFDPDFAGQARRIHTAIASKPSLSGQLIRVNRPVST